MDKVGILLMLLLCSAISAEDLDTDFTVDLNTVSYSRNGTIYISDAVSGDLKEMKYDASIYNFVSTYGNGEFILLENIKSYETFWFTTEGKSIGYCGSHFGGSTKTRNNYPDSDRRYVTTNVSTYAFDAAEISKFEIAVFYPFPISLWAMNDESGKFSYDEYREWYQRQRSDEVVRLAGELSLTAKQKLPDVYLANSRTFIKSDAFKNAMIDFISFYGVSGETRDYILNYIKKYSLDWHRVLKTMDYFSYMYVGGERDDPRAWVQYASKSNYYLLNRMNLKSALE